MKRTTVFLPEALERDLQGLARREGKPLAWFVREALAAYVAAHRRAAGLPSFAGVGAGQASDVAERHEELLWTTPHPAAPPPAAARARRLPGEPPGADIAACRSSSIPAFSMRLPIDTTTGTRESSRISPTSRSRWWCPSPWSPTWPTCSTRDSGAAAEQAFVRSLVARELDVESLRDQDVTRAAAILERYPEIGFTDASVVAMAERLKVRRIATTDRRDFARVRPRHVDAFELVP